MWHLPGASFASSSSFKPQQALDTWSQLETLTRERR
eukprot:CAMPEP_0115182984 /NCGR_PEP_ID=MMETSP0270-20121206/8225_1 /TAXON_ID=71861 /ORGANISM="Scrippsiella trochoidea, Strain CCMP3099" /LENGTH=35 /DNA_ID= /DNA_START= /DNA_END= /DNA_ORIENTATION=